MENRARRLSDELLPLVALASALAATVALGMETITVSEPGGAGFAQSDPLVIGTSEGALIAFRDSRSGFNEDRLRALDHNGVPRAPSIPLEATVFPALESYDLVLGANQSGDAVAVWGVSGVGGRHAVRIDPATAEPIGEQRVILGDEPGVNANSEVTVEVAPDGTSLVFFMANTQFRGRLYNSDFDALGPSFLIESDTGGNYVDTSFHDGGTFTLAWTGVEEPYFSMVRSQRYGADGTPLGDVFDLTSDADAVFIDTPAIAGRPDGTALVAWLRWTGEAGIWGQLLDESGVPDGLPTLLVEASAILGDPRDVYAKEDGSWALVQHLESGGGAASIEIFTSDMMSTGSEATILETYQSDAAWMAATESVLLVWETDSGSTNVDIEGSLVSTDRAKAGSPSTLSDDPNGADQMDVVLDGNADGRMVVVWTDTRNGGTDVYMQIYDEAGAPVGGNLYVSAMEAFYGTPNDVSMNASGEILIGWQEHLDGQGVIMLQRYDANGLPAGEPIDVTSGSPELYEDFVVALLEDGSFLASWNTFTELPPPGYFEIDMYVRMFNADGTPRTDEPQRLNLPHYELRDHHPAGIVANSDGSVSVFCNFERWSADGAWLLGDGAMFRAVSPSGLPSNEENHFLSTSDILWEMSVAGDAAGFVVAWTDVFTDVVKVRHYSSEGVERSQDVLSGAADARNPIALIGPDRTRLVAFDNRSTPIGIPEHELNVQRYDVLGEPVGEPMNVFTIGDELDYPIYGRGPDAVAAGDRFLYGYSAGSGTDQGFDVRMSWVEMEQYVSGDYNCDHSVNGMDISRLLGFWGMSLTDLTGDGTTDGLDLAILLGNWTG